ncbi:hypothetical protein QKT49_gp086 [Acanthamoeba castellanii medusavirus]|uniref:Uncharacterized protein n=1 Tax=Acanthamoeba castellanii medusavirus J1 TaxID=3114988 RepID=A0A3T1CWM0_9VIRU|nr:hypothetical protein QKT49_gp086 [Acanthamoeba castellanii medusavirus]BBI30226.1 hypothetical protein [Acanthamoeba castellanii medusavirus J1]
MSLTDFAYNNKLRSVQIEGYFKYEFMLSFQTHPSGEHPYGTRGTMMTGGQSGDIYNYRPKSRNWDEHEAAEIKWIDWQPLDENDSKWDSSDDEEYDSD